MRLNKLSTILKRCLPHRETKQTYWEYSPSKRWDFLMSVAKHLIWADMLHDLMKQTRDNKALAAALRGQSHMEIENETEPVYMLWALWLSQVWIAFDGLKERGIEIPEGYLNSQDQRTLHQFRNVNKHVSSRPLDKRILRTWEDRDLPIRAYKAQNEMMAWIISQPEWHIRRP